MRLIKFRAWDKTRTVGTYDTYTLKELLAGRCRNPQDYENWCEFTGLKDKNGKEIYEGDIVRWSNNKGENWKTGQIEWNNHELGYRIKENYIDYTPAIYFPNIEVIGNIYENPELLEAK